MNFIELSSGKTVEGDEIKVFRSDKKSKEYIYLIAGVHGDEPEGVYVLKKLVHWLEEDEQIDIPLIIIPTLNIDGLRNNSRVNSNGVDLNRNLPSSNWSSTARERKYFPGQTPLSEPENIFLDKLFQKFPPKLILSFHAWKPFINYNGNGEKIANFLANYNGYEICAEIKNHPTPGSLGEYVPEKYGAAVITFEFPEHTELSMEEIWLQNEMGLKELLKSDLI